jgi:protein polybromo-1
MEENPGVRFGEISRTIAEKWKQLNDQEKKTYQERSKKYNEDKEAEEQEKRRIAEIAAANAARNIPLPVSSPGLQHPGAPGSPGMRVRQESGGAHNGMPQMNGMNGMMPLQPQVQVRADPLFHVVPPKPQRLLHSEAYIKYIEGLSKDTKTMCNWDKQLQATNQGSRMQDESKLPASWLSSTGEHTTSTEALWALRDFMMHESPGVVRLM